MKVDCCIAGGGPAGMMLGYLLARSGARVAVLEKHADFLRDFRGDTVHPSTLQVLAELGLLEKFSKLPQRKVRHLEVWLDAERQPAIDFRGLSPFDYMALVPQWDFLNLLAAEAKQRYAGFDLRMRHEVLGVIERDGRIAGVSVRTPEGPLEIEARVTVGCDGRHSTLRAAAHLRGEDYGAPMDVLWFRMARRTDDPAEAFAVLGAGRMMVLLDRNDYWQAAYVVPKGSDAELRARPITDLRSQVAKLAPFLADRVEQVASWDAVKTLEVRVDRLEHWHRPGLLLIGDAAHAMSPIGGVGINLAIQDAVAASNALVPALAADGVVNEAVLAGIQARRLPPTRLTQAIQLQMQRRLISRVLAASAGAPRLPGFLRWLLGFRAVRHIPARVFGYGLRPEHVRTAEAVRS